MGQKLSIFRLIQSYIDADATKLSQKNIAIA